MLDGLEPNCNYWVDYEYLIVCTSGWNPEEGFNPNYCNMTITIIDVYATDCPGGGTDLQNCITNGGTPAECACQIYGGTDCENEEDCNKTTLDFNNIANSLQSGAWNLQGGSILNQNNSEWLKPINWKFARYFNGLGMESGWKSYERVMLKYIPGVLPGAGSGSWEFVSNNHIHDSYNSYGSFFAYKESIAENHPVNFYQPNNNTLNVKLDVTVTIEFVCKGSPLTSSSSVTPENVLNATAVYAL